MQSPGHFAPVDGSEDVEQLEPVEEDHRDRARVNSSHIDDPTRSSHSGARAQVDPVAAAQRPAGQPTAVLQDSAVVLDDGGGDGIVVVAGDQDAVHAAPGGDAEHGAERPGGHAPPPRARAHRVADLTDGLLQRGREAGAR